MFKVSALLSLTTSRGNSNYLFALAMDPHAGIITSSDSLPPDFFLNNPKLFKSKKGDDPDTPGIMEALSGPHRDEFLEAMRNEIAELEGHGTWTVMKRSEVPKEKKKDGILKEITFLAGT